MEPIVGRKVELEISMSVPIGGKVDERSSKFLGRLSSVVISMSTMVLVDISSASISSLNTRSASSCGIVLYCINSSCDIVFYK